MQRYTTETRKEWEVLGGSERSQAALMTVAPGGSVGGPDNRHEDSDQWLLVLEGTGEAIVGGKRTELSKGVLVLVEAGESHEIKNTGDGPLRTLDLYAPPEY
ncbi:MAG: cupin domain-containing protein [Candidatus Omnitrophica bacterium]|nr:cupin domain-containing protein [Candidatus Omnitrophota bacterium]